MQLSCLTSALHAAQTQLTILLSVKYALSFLKSSQSQEDLAMSVVPHVRQSQTGVYGLVIADVARSLLHNLVCCKLGGFHFCIAILLSAS